MAAEKNDSQSKVSRGYTEPLGLMAQLKRPPIIFDMIPVLDLLVIALLFSLLFTRFVMVPGVRVDLPDSGMQMQPSNLPVAVLTIVTVACSSSTAPFSSSTRLTPVFEITSKSCQERMWSYSLKPKVPWICSYF